MSRYQSNSRDSRDSRDSRSSNPDCKVYVGGLGSSFDKHDIEESFKSFGPLRHVWVARNPPGFAFVEFEDPLDAEDAVRGHRKRICGREVTVEMSSGERKNRRFGGPGGSRPPPRRASRNDKCYFCSDYGHFARECPKNDGRGGGGRRYSGGGGGGGGGYGGRSRDNRRSRSRTRSRSRSRSYSPRRRDSRSKSRSRSRSRSHSHHRRSSSHEKE